VLDALVRWAVHDVLVAVVLELAVHGRAGLVCT
jgi:hypothetical protein